MKLFAVYLGGSAPRANIELHDMAFAVGTTIEDTYGQLLESWFGSPDGIQLDSWVSLEIVDGHRVSLSTEPSNSPLKLFFINLGAYAPGELIELHANIFLVGTEKRDIVKRARESCLRGMKLVHRDYLYDVDECLEVGAVGRYYVHLEPTTEVQPFEPANAYHLIPKALVAEFKASRASSLP